MGGWERWCRFSVATQPDRGMKTGRRPLGLRGHPSPTLLEAETPLGHPSEGFYQYGWAGRTARPGLTSASFHSYSNSGVTSRAGLPPPKSNVFHWDPSPG